MYCVYIGEGLYRKYTLEHLDMIGNQVGHLSSNSSRGKFLCYIFSFSITLILFLNKYFFFKEKKPTKPVYEAMFSECTNIGAIQQPSNRHLSVEFLFWVQSLYHKKKHIEDSELLDVFDAGSIRNRRLRRKWPGKGSKQEHKCRQEFGVERKHRFSKEYQDINLTKNSGLAMESSRW